MKDYSTGPVVISGFFSALLPRGLFSRGPLLSSPGYWEYWKEDQGSIETHSRYEGFFLIFRRPNLRLFVLSHLPWARTVHSVPSCVQRVASWPPSLPMTTEGNQTEPSPRVYH
ncbi:hypothetical protein PM082_011609 [Marasmius tenuissimus]|nr:hypothetical protein PM082_011609 [Marasmius tenuissimus]